MKVVVSRLRRCKNVEYVSCALEEKRGWKMALSLNEEISGVCRTRERFMGHRITHYVNGGIEKTQVRRGPGLLYLELLRARQTTRGPSCATEVSMKLQ